MIIQHIRYAKLLALIVPLTGCSIFSAGTLGTFQQWTFSASEKRLSQEMNLLYQNNSNYIIPNKWKDLDNWEERGFGFLKGKIVYLKEKPEEMYYISYSETEPNSFGNDNDFTITTISVRALNNGSGKWDTKDDLKNNKAEIDRIDKRFYNEIIVKLERQMSLKAENTTPWYEQ